MIQPENHPPRYPDRAAGEAGHAEEKPDYAAGEAQSPPPFTAPLPPGAPPTAAAPVGPLPPQPGPGYPPQHPLPPGPYYGPPMPVMAAGPPALPATPEPYHHFWRTPGIRAWRLVVMLLLAPIAFLIVTTVGVIGVLLVSAARGADVEAMLTEVMDGRIGPDMLVANMVGLALLVPTCFLLALLSRQRPGFLSSVVGRFRWRWALICGAVALAAVLIAGVSMELLSESGESVGLEVQSYSWALFAILMLVTPLQAAGEEYLLRGIGFRAIASLIPVRSVGLVVSAIVTSAVFMAIHNAADPWLNTVYFTMGLLFCYLTWRTGGIEAAVAMHVANNIVGMALVPFTDFSDLFERSEGSGSALMLIQLAMLIAAAAVIEVLARRRKLEWAAAPAAHGDVALTVAESKLA